VDDTRNGRISADVKSAEAGDTVTLTVTPDNGYKLDTLTVQDGKGKDISLTKKSDGIYTFTAPAGKIVIKATFVPAAELPFTDVDSNDWFFDAVAYVCNKDIMAGNGDNTFGPTQELTRAMVAQVLFNLDEDSYTGAASRFGDVTAGAWYENAINWAAAEGVVSGYGDGRFGTMDSVTREQLAVILRNYAVSRNYTLEGKADLTQYTDAADIAFWAVDAMEWAAANNILRSNEGRLAPTDCASRADVAFAMMQFCENIVK
jgi:hypothetical protein